MIDGDGCTPAEGASGRPLAGPGADAAAAAALLRLLAGPGAYITRHEDFNGMNLWTTYILKRHGWMYRYDQGSR